MRNFLAAIGIILSLHAFSQRPTQQDAQRVTDSIAQATADLAKNKSKPNSANENGSAESEQKVPSGTNKRISIIAGIGASVFGAKLYIDPVVNPTNNFVQLQRAKSLKSNLSLGIAYTPYIQDVINVVSSVDGAGNIITNKKVESGPRGFTIAAFLNPILLSKITENQNFFNSPDIGMGIGFRTIGGLSILATAELFWVQQPRDWFIDQYKGNNATYTVGDEVQKSIDLNDKNIFASKPVLSFGIKLAYTFDIIKTFSSTTSTIVTTNKSEEGSQNSPNINKGSQGNTTEPTARPKPDSTNQKPTNQ